MNILVIGGTRFFGIHMVNELLTAGYDVTIATRGKASDSFGDISELKDKGIIERKGPDNGGRWKIR